MPATALPSSGRRAFWVLVVSGILGFRVGMVGFPDWQVAVETAQVVAGLVRYPDGNPFYLYHTRLWTALHQICALFLLGGVSEIRLSLVLSGVLGMVTFQALSMVVYAFSRDALLAIGAAVLIFFTRAADYGGVYGLFLLGNENTYGILGLSFCVLAVALIGSGCIRAGALLLGLAPAIHASLGAWTAAIVFCAFLWDFRRLRVELRPALPWFLGGCGLTLLSLVVQLAFVYRPPPAGVGGALSSQELAAFISFWDGHRKPVDPANDGVALNAAALALTMVWLVAFARNLPRSSIFLLRFIAVTAMLSIAAVFVSRIPPDRLPTLLLVLMPGRILNFDALIYAALLIGLIGHYRRTWGRLLLLGLCAGLLVGDHSMLWEWLRDERGIRYESHVHPLQIVWAASIALAIGAWYDKRLAPADASSTAPRLLAALPVGVMLLAAVLSLGFERPRAPLFRDRTTDVFFGHVAAGPGLLLTAGDLHLVQLKTRRPVLVDGGGLDGLLYSLDGGAAMMRILHEVYGIDLAHPPEEARGSGRIPPIATRKVWEERSLEQWQKIGRAFGVTQVLTYPDWTLDLPMAAQSRWFLLYNIP